MNQGDTVTGASYVAIIMDGNARWARARGLSVLEGHRAGAESMKRAVKSSVELGIKELTVYAFSTENWNRPSDEVDGLMAMFTELIASETPELDRQGVKIKFIGRKRGIDGSLAEKMDWAESETSSNDRLKLFVAFNYGGRKEIVDAAMKFSNRSGLSEQEIESDDDKEVSFASCLYAPDMNEPELLIRTSGEKRISNFLLWQCAYTELYFTDVLWPDFDRSNLKLALEDYESRMRRFGARDADC